MKGKTLTGWSILIVLVLLLSLSIVEAADTEYKPYLHKPSIPEHPKMELYGAYKTNLFPGAATYSYPIRVPKGTNNLHPSVSLLYNSQTVKQRPGIVGAGWMLTQSFIYRDINYTPSDTTDDKFKLILNGELHELLFNANDSLFHTKIETYMKIENLSGAPNSYSTYWLITAKDGTRYRFGYNPDSELTSNQGRDYALRWSLDQAEDTFGNKIYYTYLEDQYAQDIGAVYPYTIIYNNDQSRKVEFSYESSLRPDRRRVFDQGNLLEESRRLTNISVSVGNSLVRKYAINYEDLNAEKTLSSISNIAFYGADGTSPLHSIGFDYSEPEQGFTNHTSDWLSPPIAADTWPGSDFGVRYVDLNNDGFVDVIEGRQSQSQKRAWINNHSTGWNLDNDYAPPDYITNLNSIDKGIRFIDLNDDGFLDILHGEDSTKKAYINNGDGWVEVSQWAPPIAFMYSSVDQGLRIVDLNGDGRLDLLKRIDSTKSAYLNNGTGWTDVAYIWTAPVAIISGTSDNGVREADVNGDGLTDLLQGIDKGTPTYKAWINTGSGFVDNSSTWAPPVVFTSSQRIDEGVRLADINGDGLVDLWQDYANGTTTIKSAWLNNGSGWVESGSWQAPDRFTKDGKNIGRRIGDVNGDGWPDIIIAYETGAGPQYEIRYTLIKNETKPYVLTKVTNELGGEVEINYDDSTNYNNSAANGSSQLGFSLLVVKDVLQNNSMSTNFSVIGNHSYNYTGGMYDYADKEFRGFNLVVEKQPDNSTIWHYFHQDDVLKGRENLTFIYDSSGALYSKTDNDYNYTTDPNGYFKVYLGSSSNSLYDGSAAARVTNESYAYDDYGNVVNKAQHGDVSIEGDEKYEHYDYAYNTTFWIINKVSRYQLFKHDNSTKVKEAKYSYDGLGYTASPTKGSVTKAESWLENSENPVVEYAYDSYGNVLTVTDPLERVTTYTYGLRDSTFTYPDRETNALGHVTDYSYNVSTGNLNWREKNKIRTTYYYDVFGRITKEVLPYDNYELPTKTYTYYFDGIAPEYIKESSRTSANKRFDVYYFYDGMANLVQLKKPSDNNQQVVKNLFYDGLGRAISEQNPYFADSESGLSNVSETTNKTFYTYDTLDRVTTVLNPDGTYLNVTYNKHIITDYDANGHKHNYYIDDYGRITNVIEYNKDIVLGGDGIEIYNTTYAYDTQDNIIEINDTLGNQYTFTYDSLGRKIQFTDPDTSTWNYTYDRAGNLISQIGGVGKLISGDGFFREYNGFGQLVRVRNGTNTSVILEEYTYDADGNRVKVVQNDSAQTTIYTPFRELMRIINSSGTYDYTYIYDGSTLVARNNPDGTKWFYHPDHLGSTSLITDQDGNVVEETFYEPFGAELSGGQQDMKGYTGQFDDSLTNQYYYGARYYKPELGQFISADPVIQNIYNPQDLNHYSYVRNNPYRYVDPDGEEVMTAVLIGAGLISMGTEIYIQVGYTGGIYSARKVFGAFVHGVGLGAIGISSVATGGTLGTTLGVAEGAYTYDSLKRSIQEAQEYDSKQHKTPERPTAEMHAMSEEKEEKESGEAEPDKLPKKEDKLINMQNSNININQASLSKPSSEKSSRGGGRGLGSSGFGGNVVPGDHGNWIGAGSSDGNSRGSGSDSSTGSSGE